MTGVVVQVKKVCVENRKGGATDCFSDSRKYGDIETRLTCLKIDCWAKGTNMQNHTDLKRSIVCYRNGEDQNVVRTLGVHDCE